MPIQRMFCTVPCNGLVSRVEVTKSSMTLYDHPDCPFAQKVRIVLAEKELSYDTETVDLAAGAQRSPEFRRLNPFGQVPVLVDEEVVDVHGCAPGGEGPCDAGADVLAGSGDQGGSSGEVEHGDKVGAVFGGWKGESLRSSP